MKPQIEAFARLHGWKPLSASALFGWCGADVRFPIIGGTYRCFRDVSWHRNHTEYLCERCLKNMLNAS